MLNSTPYIAVYTEVIDNQDLIMAKNLYFTRAYMYVRVCVRVSVCAYVHMYSYTVPHLKRVSNQHGTKPKTKQ